MTHFLQINKVAKVKIVKESNKTKFLMFTLSCFRPTRSGLITILNVVVINEEYKIFKQTSAMEFCWLISLKQLVSISFYHKTFYHRKKNSRLTFDLKVKENQPRHIIFIVWKKCELYRSIVNWCNNSKSYF